MRNFFPLATVLTLGLLASCGQAPEVPVKGQTVGEPAGKLSTSFKPGLTQNIVYGSVSARGARPYQAYLDIRDGQSSLMCGGSIISNGWILTAAHCVDGMRASNITVRVGVNDLRTNQGQSIRASALYQHNSYRGIGGGYDIALIKLSSPIRYDSYTQPIKLPSNSVESVLDVAGKYATVSGWGITESGRTSDVLREVALPITPNPTRCGGDRTPANTICGEYYQDKDSCNGDSGGPLAQKYNGQFYVLGIVSYGPDACRGYGVYTRVNAYLPWIKQVSGVTADTASEPVGDSTGETPGTTTYTGNFASGQYDYAPSSNGFFYNGGTIKGVMTGPAGTDFDLYLEKKGSSNWAVVAKSEGSSADETITYKAASGTYRWKIVSYSGSGDVKLVETK